MADGVASTIGDNGARATMRLAGYRAAVDLLEALPLLLSVDDAIQRAGPVMAELGFVSAVTPVDDEHVHVLQNASLGRSTDIQRRCRDMDVPEMTSPDQSGRGLSFLRLFGSRSGRRRRSASLKADGGGKDVG